VPGASHKLDQSPFPAIHPNDHVNLGQSTNDVFPTAVHVAAAVAIRDRLIPALERCGEVLAAKAAGWKDILKIGRTHLADATPLSLGQEIGGLARQLERSTDRAVASHRSPAGAADRRNRRRHRHQHPRRLRPPRVRRAGERNRHPVCRSGRPLRGQRPARRAGRVSRALAHHRRNAVQRG